MNFPPGAERLGNGPQSTVFWWHGKMYRYAQGRKGGTIYVAHPDRPGSLIGRAYWRRRSRRIFRGDPRMSARRRERFFIKLASRNS